MKITDGNVLLTSPGRNFVTLRLQTDDAWGLGDATLNGRELAVASYLENHVLPLLVGRDAFQIDDIWHELYKGAYWRRGPVTMTALGAVDVALWDLKAKALGVPVYELLGGRARERVRVYGHASGATPEAAVESVARFVEMGYTAVRLQCGFEGLPDTYGVGRGDLYYEPASPGRPRVETWDTTEYLTQIEPLFALARRELGPKIELLHDVHHRLTPNEAARLGRLLEPYRLFWLEDATPAELQEGFRRIRSQTTTPLAVGEVFNSVYDVHTLITEQLIDYVRMAVAHSGGLTHMVRVAHLAELFQVRMACHGPTDLSPVNLAASLHFGTAIHNFGIQEYMRHSPETDEIFTPTYELQDGHMYVSDDAGLGVSYDDQSAEQYEYTPAYLPVARLGDGTVHSW